MTIRYNRLAIILKELDINQKEFAELLGAKGLELKDKISRWCSNKNQPSLQELYKISKILRINIRELIEPTNWEKEPHPSPVELLIARREKERQKARTDRKRSER